jgi:hypothetical protein
MRRIDYLDTGPPEAEKQGADWRYKSQPDPKDNIAWLHSNGPPQCPRQETSGVAGHQSAAGAIAANETVSYVTFYGS